MNYKQKICTAILASCLTTPVFAKGIAFMNIDLGGDTLVDVTYTNGDKADIDAGQGITFGAGQSLQLSDDLILQFTGAFKFATTPQASNGSISWTRIPIEAIAYYDAYAFRLGAGITYHLANSLSGSGAASAVNQDFENALGLVFSYEHMLTPHMAINARYTMIEYTPEFGGTPANGDSIGVGINFYYGQ